MLIRNFVFLTLLISANTFAQSPAETLAGYSKTCYQMIITQVSIMLHISAHHSLPGSKSEQDTQIVLDEFNRNNETFPLFETACNEAFQADQKYICYTQGYVNETLSIIDKYDAEFAVDLETSPECSILSI